MKAKIIQAIIDQQLNGSDIARKYGVSRQYVGQIAAQVGIKPNRKQAKPPYQRKRAETDPLAEQKRKYRAHKRRAEHRGIEFLLTFDEWWSIWEPHYHNMGKRKGQMCMCRTLDRGPYAVGNVRIDYAQSNGHEKIISRIENRGTRWMGPMTKKGCGMNLPNSLMICQAETVEEDPFVYYAELVTSHAYTKRN